MQVHLINDFDVMDVIRLLGYGDEAISAHAGTHQQEPRGFVRLALEVYPLKRRNPRHFFVPIKERTLPGTVIYDTEQRAPASKLHYKWIAILLLIFFKVL
jgi:hypothetical protein